jgi:hypothetical protein
LDVTNIDKLPVTTHRIDKPFNDIIYVSEAPDIHLPQAYFMRQHRSSFFMLEERFISKNKSTCKSKCSYFWRRHPDLNWGIEVLQTSALPLGYGAILNCTLSLSKKCQLNLIGIKRMERMTRLELATSTLARWRSTG